MKSTTYRDIEAAKATLAAARTETEEAKAKADAASTEYDRAMKAQALAQGEFNRVTNEVSQRQATLGALLTQAVALVGTNNGPTAYKAAAVLSSDIAKELEDLGQSMR